MTLWSRLTDTISDEKDDDGTGAHRRTDGGQIAEPAGEQASTDNERAGSASVQEGVWDDQIARAEAVAAGETPADDAAEMGERLLRQGAPPSAIASILDVGIESPLDETFEQIESGELEHARSLLEDRLSVLTTDVERKLEAYDQAQQT